MKLDMRIGANTFLLDGSSLSPAEAKEAMLAWLAASQPVAPGPDGAALQAIAGRINTGVDAIDAAGKALDHLEP